MMNRNMQLYDEVLINFVTIIASGNSGKTIFYSLKSWRCAAAQSDCRLLFIRRGCTFECKCVLRLTKMEEYYMNKGEIRQYIVVSLAGLSTMNEWPGT